MAKTKNNDLSTLVYGKVPPQAKDLERYILGAILMEPYCFDIASEILTEQCFYVTEHQKIFQALVSMNANRMPIELMLVIEKLKAMEMLDLVGGPYFVTKLTNEVTGTNNLDKYCRIVLQKYLQRELIRIGGEMISTAYEDSADVFDLLDSAEKGITEVVGKITITDYRSLNVEMDDVVKKLYSLRDVDTTVSGIPSGFKEIDRIIHGWQPTDLIILAARPSVGKTAFALNFARNGAKTSQKPVGIFSLEMSGQQLAMRLISAESEIFLESIRTGKLGEDWEGKIEQIYERGVLKLEELNILIDDTSINMFQIRSKARKMVRKQGVAMIIIDYLQLIQGSNKGQNKEQQISDISRDLKLLAKELKIPIIALSQLSREVEKRGSEEPRLSDLRDSGSIEQDADIVFFVWRPSDAEIEKNAAEKYVRYYKVAKHRNGALDKNVLAWYPEIQKLMNKDDQAPRYVTGSSWKPITQLGIAIEDEPF